MDVTATTQVSSPMAPRPLPEQRRRHGDQLRVGGLASAALGFVGKVGPGPPPSGGWLTCVTSAQRYT